MKTVTIRDLHHRTGDVVRAAAREKILITERGRAIALLKGIHPAELNGEPFPKRDRRKLPKVRVDSTSYISEDRDGR
jgi:antitoxin (DNA-binding transcriptional repressor) of toxin-antitoxin stability system